MNSTRLIKLYLAINICFANVLSATSQEESDTLHRQKISEQPKEVVNPLLSQQEASELIRRYQNPPTAVEDDEKFEFHQFTYKTPDGHIVHTE